MRSISFTIFLLLLAIVAGGMVAMRVSEGNLHRVFGPPPTGAGDRLYDFDPALASSIVLTGNGATAHCALRHGRWQVISPWQDRMDPVFAKAIIAFTLGTRVVDAIPRDEFDEEKKAFSNNAIRIRIEDSSGKALAKYILGPLTAVTHLDPETGEEHPTVFLRPRESGRDDYVYACTGDIHPIFKDGFRYLRDHRPFYFDPRLLQSIRIRNAEGGLTLSRQSPDDTSPWRITKPLELGTDVAAVKQLLEDLYLLRAKSVLNRAEVTLPSADEGNVESIALRHFGEAGERTLQVFPPATPEAETQYAIVDDRPDAVLELLRRPLAGGGNRQEDMVSLAALPNTVNQLRDKFLTRLHITAVRDIRILPATGTEIYIGRESPRDGGRVLLDGEMQPLNPYALGSLFKVFTQIPVTAFVTDAAGGDLSPYGLDRPSLRVSFTSFQDEVIEFLFGLSRNGIWHVMRAGTTTVARLDDQFIRGIAIKPWQWRQTVLWSIAAVDLKTIERTIEDRPTLELAHEFVSESWSARENGRDRSAELSTARANRLLATLLELNADAWLAADDPRASAALANPALRFSLGIDTYDDEGESTGIRRRALAIAPASDSPGSGIFYARIDGEPHPFLLNPGTVRQLAVDLFGDD